MTATVLLISLALVGALITFVAVKAAVSSSINASLRQAAHNARPAVRFGDLSAIPALQPRQVLPSNVEDWG
jgi:hypothetical protein